MKVSASKWHPVPDVEAAFGSISYAYRDDALTVWMQGDRTLELVFSHVIAVHFEQECPALDFPDVTLLPKLESGRTFPLLTVQGSRWLREYTPIYGALSHFAFISSDTLIQVLATASVHAAWSREAKSVSA